MKRLLVIALLGALAACGSREPLQPAPGASLPPTPRMASRAPTTDELLTPTTIARPDRVDELLRRSEPRQDDRYDLPPPEVPVGIAPVLVDIPEPE